MSIILFFIGFILLIQGARMLIRGASSLAKRFRVSDLVIGLTIIAFGTSAPELIINLIASAKGGADIALANVIGSNISNIFLILGISAIIYPLEMKRNTVWREIPFGLLSILILAILIKEIPGNTGVYLSLDRFDGLILVSFFLLFIFYTFKNGKIKGEEEIDVPKYNIWLSLVLIIAGSASLALGGEWIVDGALSIASIFGLSQAFIGLTVIAIGTSLPELATSLVAAYRKNPDIAIGNIVGSNIFNILWVLGLSTAIKPLIFSDQFIPDIVVLILANILLFTFLFIGKRNILERWQGIFFVVLYTGYLVFLGLRG